MSASSAPPSGSSAPSTGSTCCAQEIQDYYGHFRVTPDLIELRNLLEVADLIVRSALAAHESRGLHYTLDYPDQLPEPKDTILPDPLNRRGAPMPAINPGKRRNLEKGRVN